MKSFLQGKKTLPLAALRAPAGFGPASHTHAVATEAGAMPTAPGHAPSVEVVKEGDKVVRLVVTCGCGERVEIECLYPAGH